MNFGSYSMKVSESNNRKLSTQEDPKSLSMGDELLRDSNSTINTTTDSRVNGSLQKSQTLNEEAEDDKIINDELNRLGLEEKEEEEEEDSDLSFELYEDLIERERLIGQLKGTNVEESRELSDFLLENYKYWSLEDLSKSLGELLKDLDLELINLVNKNYLHYINLGKSIDGSLDLIHDIKFDLNSYLKGLKNENENINQDILQLNQFRNEKDKLMMLNYVCECIIKLSELVECFDKLVHKFDLGKENSKTVNIKESVHGSRIHMLLELTASYFSINRLFVTLLNNTRVYNSAGSNLSLEQSKIINGLGRKMNGLKLEFISLLNNHVKELKVNISKDPLNENYKNELFELFKVCQLMELKSDFKKAIST